MYTYDTETVCLSGPAVLLQYAIDDGPIILYDIWLKPIKETLELIHDMMEQGTTGFNLTFDHFQLSKLWTMFDMCDFKSDKPIDHIDELAIIEERARFHPKCIKPKHCFDVMLHARKGPYQSTMNRDDIVIKRVPTALAWQLAQYLDEHVPLKDIYFARYADPKRRWQVLDCDSPDFKNVVLKFAPSSALKALAQDALGVENAKYYKDIEPPKRLYPLDKQYAPWALSIGKPENSWRGSMKIHGKIVEGFAWPFLIKYHIEFWKSNEEAREYAWCDVDYTRRLYDFFNRPPIDDIDSQLACMVASVRWHGFAVDVDGIKELKQAAIEKRKAAPSTFQSVQVVKRYVGEVMSPEELIGFTSTKKEVLEKIAKWRQSTVCQTCQGMGCTNCEEGLVSTDEMHPAAERAKLVLSIRKTKKEIELYDKLILAGRLHPDFKIIGTKSTRMSGSGGLNAQGINRSKVVRKKFPLADQGMQLCGGDAVSFEVVLMDAVYADPDLRADLLKTEPCRECKATGKKNEKTCKDCKGTGEARIKIHGLFGTFLFPPLTYDEIMATKGLPGSQDKYSLSKSGVFSTGYGGNEHTLVTRLGVSEEAATRALHRWCDRYRVWARERQKYNEMFCSMKQPGGIGTKVEWADPAEYIESMMGFRRYFTLENTICKILFELASEPPKEWQGIKIKVVRRDREQTACGALRSALFACAFAMQAANMRAGGNHVIQSAGASLIKILQTRIWDLQPAGIAEWQVVPMNVHDEIMCPARPEHIDPISSIVSTFIEEFRPKVPLLDIDWGNNLKSWADK